MDTSEIESANKLAKILRNMQVSGSVMDMDKAGVMMNGRLGYEFEPNQQGNNWQVGVGGQHFVKNPYGIPSTINSLDVSYGNPNQNVTLGYYPNKSQVFGTPIGAGGVSLEYRKTFD